MKGGGEKGMKGGGEKGREGREGNGRGKREGWCEERRVVLVQKNYISIYNDFDSVQE